MHNAQTIIAELKKRGMNYTSIGAAIGISRVSVSRIAHGQQSGEHSLSKLQKLASSADINIAVPYVPPDHYEPSEPDVAPLTEEELLCEQELDKYEQWEPFAPIASTVGRAIDGTRGKLVERILPEGYSVIRSSPHWSENMRVVESVPRPHRPRRRKPRTRSISKTYVARPEHHPILLIAGIILSAFLPKPVTSQTQFPGPQIQRSSPRYVPTNQWVPTHEYVTLAYPKNVMPHVDSLGYAQNEVGEPVQPHIYFGSIPTNRYNP